VIFPGRHYIKQAKGLNDLWGGLSGVIFCYNQTMPRELLGKIEKPRGKNSG
jgi:hypothetical protein